MYIYLYKDIILKCNDLKCDFSHLPENVNWDQRKLQRLLGMDQSKHCLGRKFEKAKIGFIKLTGYQSD